ncbi:MAG TPA: methyltransferase domain-containing protein [Micromonosporaceae bacterium]
MSRFEAAFCRGATWRTFAGGVILPWALRGQELNGEVLEIGAGGGSMAARLLANRPGVRMTVTDYDDAMAASARARLARFGARATVLRADATRLPFPDARFDAVVSFIMLHHVIAWETAIDEAVRVLRPGGALIGYDLLATPVARALHQANGSRNRLIRFGELGNHLSGLPVEVRLKPGLAGLIVRFTLQKTST